MRPTNLPSDPMRPVPGSEKWFVGHRTESGCRVLVWDGSRHRPLSPMLSLLRKSPTGFEWGYGGSGPAQLSFAILWSVYQDEDFCLSTYQEFKYHVISRLEKRAWTISESEVKSWMDRMIRSRHEDEQSILFKSVMED